jgi:cyclopropane fatty-acyl-phospholipid synthase-like methyltransferase
MNEAELKEKLDKLKPPRKKFYQTYKPLGITGQRDSEERFRHYRIKEIARPDFEVLDIGCNYGFLSLYIAEHVKIVHGLEPVEKSYKIGKLVRNYIGEDCVKVFPKKWVEFKPSIKYDLVLSLAVHKWVGVPFEKYITRVKKMLKPQGYFLIESHCKIIYDTDWDRKVDLIKSNGFTQLWKGDSSEGGRVREFVMFRFT